MKHFSLLFVLCSLLLFSCKEKGCTDFEAYNYEDFADDDDGSCHYDTRIAFVNSENTQDIIDQGGALTVSLAGTAYPTIDYNELNVVQNCSVGSITINMEQEKTMSLSYTALLTDNDGLVIISDTISFDVTAADCKVLEI